MRLCTSSRLAAWILLLVSAPLAGGQERAQDLVVGHWVEVKGALEGRGVFRASSIEVMAPGKRDVLIGEVERFQAPDRFFLLGQAVAVSPKTTWSGVQPEDLVGKRVEVHGYYRGPHKFSARRIEARGPGRDRIEGRIDRIEPSRGRLELWILGFQVQVDGRQELVLGQPLSDLPLSPQRTTGVTPFKRDEEDELPGTVRLGKSLSLGMQLEWASSWRDNRDLDNEEDDERIDHVPSVRMELVWTPGSDLLMLVGGRFKQQWRTDARSGDSSTNDTALTEAYVYWRNALGSTFDLQVGRADFDEPREWLYDESLDAVRLIGSWDLARLELSYSTVPEEDSSWSEEWTNRIAYLSNNSRRQHAAVYYIERSDSSEDHRPQHFGVRALGELLPQQRMWLEGAVLRGTYEGEEVEGLGVDVGTTWSPPVLDPWNFTVGFAYGSGDGDLEDGKSQTFRQTGLHDNNDKLGGVTSFRYYGEVLDPELANLKIFTLGVGMRPTLGSSIDLLAHYYLQDEASDATFQSRLRRQPTGLDPKIGTGVDLVFGVRSPLRWSFEFVLGAFVPGAAFEDRDIALLAAFQLRFKF